MEDLRSGIEHLKQAKAHMSEANGIMSDHISKLKALEEENVELKGELEAFIQSDDSYMKLPLDADGVPIRIGDEVYGKPGIAWTVNGLRVFDDGYQIMMTNSPFWYEPCDLTHKKPEPLEDEPADSWEKLEEDAAKEVCAYAGASFSIVNQDMYSCTGCRFDDCSSRKTSCWLQMNSELLARAKKLAGIEEEAER